MKKFCLSLLFSLFLGATAYAQQWDKGACERDPDGPNPVCPALTTSAPQQNPPTIAITGPTSNATITVSVNQITLSGNATAGSGTIASMTCANQRGGTCTVSGTTSWTTNAIALQVGSNPITVSVVNSNGGQTSDNITVTFQPPFPGNALVGAWGFENGSGTTATDSSGNANHGTLFNSPTWTTNGKFGNAISFDGVNDFVQVADSTSLDLTQSFTISAWINPASTQTIPRAAIVKNYVQYLYASFSGTANCQSGGPLAGFEHADGGNRLICQSLALPVNQWTHVAVSYDGTTMRLYRNGVEVATFAVTGLMAPTTGTLQIGASQFTGENFHGMIDEGRVYNWAIPVSAGSNTVPGAQCVFGDPLNTAQQSIIRDMNCPVIQTPTAPPLPIKLPSSATGLKVGPGATGLKFGSKAP